MQQLNRNERVISSQRVVNRDSSIPADMQRRPLDSLDTERDQKSKQKCHPSTEAAIDNNGQHEASHMAATSKIFVANVNQRKIAILRLKDVQARIGLGRSAIYYLMDQSNFYHDPTFPKSFKISTNAIGWVESEIEAWLESRIAASRA